MFHQFKVHDDFLASHHDGVGKPQSASETNARQLQSFSVQYFKHVQLKEKAYPLNNGNNQTFKQSSSDSHCSAISN
jgi:hypothetical protein